MSNTRSPSNEKSSLDRINHASQRMKDEMKYSNLFRTKLRTHYSRFLVAVSLAVAGATLAVVSAALPPTQATARPSGAAATATPNLQPVHKTDSSPPQQDSATSHSSTDTGECTIVLSPEGDAKNPSLLVSNVDNLDIVGVYTSPSSD